MNSSSSSSANSPQPTTHVLKFNSVADELQDALDYRPPRLKAHRKSSSSPLTSPILFYDKHIDQNLALKRIRILPTLLHDVSESVESTFKVMGERGMEPGIRMLPNAVARLSERDSIRPVRDAEDVAFVLKNTTATYCCILACAMFFGSRNQDWKPLLVWSKTPQGQEWTSDTVRTCLQVNHMILPSLQDDLKQCVCEVLHRFRELVIWMINPVSENTKSLFRRMDDVALSRSFASQICLTRGCALPSFIGQEVFDGRTVPWKIPASSQTTVRAFADGPSCNTRARAHTNVVSNPRVKSSARRNRDTHPDAESQRKDVHVVYPPSEAQARKRREELDNGATPEHILQHAWAEAVREDATVIIFNCGNSERIGIRHRGSQTLYISPLIRTYRCNDPPYGKLHVGLYAAALEDAVDRAMQHCEADAARGVQPTCREPSPTKPSPLTEELARRPRKRRKTHVARPAGIKSRRDAVLLEEARKRKLVFIRLQYGVYNSPTPASFRRLNSASNQQSYRPHEYITIQLTSRIGRGATGILHGGKMELETSDGQHLVYQVAVKLAFNKLQRTRLEREYGVYMHMMAANVTGIMSVIGLFQDMEGYTLALVMRHGGISLWDREYLEGRKPSVTRIVTGISPSERSAFLVAMESIHGAGVRHCDIRSANLIVNEDTGEVAIIDFDRARMDISESNARYETNKLIAVLDGNCVDEEVSPSPFSHHASREDDQSTDSESEESWP